MTTVIFTRSDLRLAGPARLMIAQAEALRDRGLTVLFATGGGDLAHEVERLGFTHHLIEELNLAGRSVRATAIAAIKMTRLIRRLHPLAIHGYNVHSAACAVPGAWAAGARALATITGAGKERWFRFVPLSYVAVSEFVRCGLIDAGVSAKRVTVVANSTLDDQMIADDETLARLSSERQARQRGGSIELCSIAMMTGGKGHDLLIEMMQNLVASGETNVTLTLVGDGVARAELEGLARELGVERFCNFVGAHPDVVPFLDASSVFVHLALLETFGLVLAEAAARGLPVVTHSVGGIPEVVADGDTGIVVGYRDVAAAADAVRRLLSDPELQLRLGRRGRDLAGQRFHRRESAERLLGLYRGRW